MIVHHVPTDDMEFLKEVALASRHVASKVYRKLANDITHNHIWFLRQSAGDTRCSTVRGYIFEEHVVESQSGDTMQGQQQGCPLQVSLPFAPQSDLNFNCMY